MKTTTTLIVGLALACGGMAQDAKPHLKEELQKLMERAHDAKNAGRLDEAKELAAHAEKIRRELQGGETIKKPEKIVEKEKPQPKHPDKHHGKEMPHFKGPPGPEAERMQHIMQAVQHLHAAGLHEPARNIEEIAQKLRHEMEERMKHAHAGGPEKPGKPHAELEEMRQQMRRMAEQIEQLQAALKKQSL